MEIVQVENVTRVYAMGEKQKKALDGVSLSIQAGEFTALVGPSGSGKTTLLNLMGCLDRPQNGTVKILGRDVLAFDADQRAALRRETIGFIFQFFALVPTLNVFENVELPLYIGGTSEQERRRRVEQLLAWVGLTDLAEYRTEQLSSGEQQRVAIARALVTQPKMVLADEPTANLDTANGAQIMRIMRRLNQETQTAFIFATHDPRVVAYMHRVVSLRQGHLESDSVMEPAGIPGE